MPQLSFKSYSKDGAEASGEVVQAQPEKKSG